MILTAFGRLIKLWFSPDELAGYQSKVEFLMLDAAPKDYRQLDDRKPEILDQAAIEGAKYKKQVQAYLDLLFG